VRENVQHFKSAQHQQSIADGIFGMKVVISLGNDEDT
jgi:hypothetical protein